MKIANGREQYARIFLKVLVQKIREIKYKSITLRKFFEIKILLSENIKFTKKYSKNSNRFFKPDLFEF